MLAAMSMSAGFRSSLRILNLAYSFVATFRPQFSLRTLLLLMLVVALPSAFDGYVYRARKNRVAVVPVPVTGTVTIDGHPAKDWSITFCYEEFDMQGATAKGTIDAAGRFTMATPSIPSMGVWPGDYAVGVAPPPGSMWIGPFQPYRYADPEWSGLKVTVSPSDKNDFQFNLTIMNYLPKSSAIQRH